MNKKMSSLHGRNGLIALMAVALGFLSTVVEAAELQGLRWLDDTNLELKLNGPAEFKTESLEDGKRLRIQLAQTALNANVTDIEGRGKVKGVFPYPADNGNAVYIDLLLSQPGAIDVKPGANGLQVRINGTGTANESTPTTAVPPAAQVIPESAAPSEASVASNAIQEISYNTLPGDRLQIKIKTSKQPETPLSFTVTNPPSISFDFANTKLDLQRKSVRVGTGAVTNVTAVEAQNRSRVVMRLVKPVAYSTHLEKDGITVVLENPTSAIGGTEPPKTTRFTTTQANGKYSLKNIDFRRGTGGDAKVIIDLSDPRVGINIYEQAGEIIVDFLDTNVPQKLQKRLDVVDFATPIDTIETFAQGRNARMVIKPHGRYEHLAYQAGNVFTVNVKPIVVAPGDEKKPNEFGYTGEKLSLNFQNIDVRAALQVIADFTNLNFVTSDTVKGSLTLRLKDVPWDQALDIITSAKGLAVRRKGNVVVVAPADEVAAKEKAALEAGKQVAELEPLVSELIQINYAKAADIAALLKSIVPVPGSVPTNLPGGSVVTLSKVETSSNSLLSPRGQVTIDPRTNSILVQDTAGKIREIRALIAKLDQPVRQVMIEARLVEATDSFSRNLGVRFGVANNVTTGGFNINQTATIGGTAGDFNVNLPAPAAATIGLSIARLGTASLINLELSALEATGSGKIISSPRLITASQKKARIEQGQERSVTTVNGLETKRAVLGLEVTPQITPDDRVILDVDITKDNFLNATDLLLATKRMNTQVLLDNGETVVIAGVYEQDELASLSQVPVFGDIPLFGWLFKNKAVHDNKTELLIFLTPRILSPALSLH